MTIKFAWSAPARFVEHDINPTPQAAQIEVGMLQARDGAMLRNAAFVPKNPKGTIVLMTGYSEFIEKYFETISDLLGMGYAVVMPEWRGHGLSDGDGSEPSRLHLADFDKNLRDLEDRWGALVAPMPRPHFGLAHSMGGLISLRAAQAHPDWFDALAQCAPMHGLPIPPHLLFIMGGFVRWLNLFGKADRWNPAQGVAVRPSDPATNNVTNDKTRFKRTDTLYVAEAQLQVNGASLGWFAAAMKAIKKSRRLGFLRSIETPLYIGSAEEELLVDNRAHAHVLAHVQNGSGKLYPKAKHELMMEKDATRQAFLADVQAFFEA